VADSAAAFGQLSVDLALDGEEHVDAFGCFDGDG
jgi:hypothetical protein